MSNNESRTEEDFEAEIARQAQGRARKLAELGLAGVSFSNGLSQAERDRNEALARQQGGMDGVVSFFRQFAQGKIRPSTRTAETYKQRYLGDDDSFSEAERTLADGTKVKVMAITDQTMRGYGEGVYQIHVNAERPDGSEESMVLSPSGISSYGQSSSGDWRPHTEGTKQTFFNGHDDPGYQDAMNRARELASELLFS